MSLFLLSSQHVGLQNGRMRKHLKNKSFLQVRDKDGDAKPGAPSTQFTSDNITSSTGVKVCCLIHS